MKRRKLILRSALGLAVFVLAAGVAAPYFNVSRYGQSIQRSLETALGRKVEIGNAHLDLFHGPGVSLENVVIHDDPSAGLEPLVYLNSGTLEARVSLRSLWTGRLEFSSLRLDEPSINIVKIPNGPWNLQPVLSRTVGAATAQAPGIHIPEIRIRGGRINFKSGNNKSVYYLTDAEVDILPPDSPGADWRFSFRGEPARADRPAHGFGEITGRGRWHPDRNTGGQVDVVLNADRSRIAELATLMHGHDLGVHGFVTANARLRGPISDLAIDGRLQVADIHRWDLLPARGEAWPLNFRGRLDLTSQRLELDTVGDTQAPLPFGVTFRASGYLSQPHWGLVVYLNRLPVRAFPGIAKQFGVAVPDGLSVEGEIEGAIGYSPASGFQGTVATRDATLRLADGQAVKVLRSQLIVDGRRVKLGPAELETARNQNATFEAGYDWDAAEFSAALSTGALDVADLQAGFGRLIGTATTPFVRECASGQWHGNLTWRAPKTGPGAWTGTGGIEAAELSIPGLSGPVALKTASVNLREDALDVTRMAGTAGGIEFRGDYHFRSEAARPHQFRISVPEADGANLEQLLAPTLARRDGLLARALRFGRASVPDWLQERNAEGTLEFGSLALAEVRLDNFRSRLRWDGPTAEFLEVHARLADEATLSGRVAVSLRRSVPSYRATVSLKSFGWRGAKWDAESVVQTSGSGADLMRNLRSQGTFSSHAVALAPETEFHSIAGSYTFAASRRAPVLKFTGIQAMLGHEAFKGTGATREDGRIEFELTDGQRQMRMSGTLSPFQLEVIRAGTP